MTGADDVDLSERARRAFAAHDAFEPADDDWCVATTAFDAAVSADPAETEQLRFTVRVTVPTLSAVTAGAVADVVEEGWTETFERRVVDVGGVTRGGGEFDPRVAVDDGAITVTFELRDGNAARGVDDAKALVDFVEGTYVQGVIPGYEYTEPVADLLSAARRQGNDGAV